MENASKALLISGGVLIGILLFALTAILFVTASELFVAYEETKSEEVVQQFNVNFTQFIGRNLGVHEVVTIRNFANEHKVTIIQENKIVEAIEEYRALLKNPTSDLPEYKLEIETYSEDGYISAISFEKVK